MVQRALVVKTIQVYIVAPESFGRGSTLPKLAMQILQNVLNMFRQDVMRVDLDIESDFPQDVSD